MIKLGVTGGIGSGKSVVCDVLRLHDIPVYDADLEAKNLNDTSPVIRKKLTQSFGQDLYRNNRLDREKLAHLIFNNEENLRTANSIIHPELAKHFMEWAEQRKHHPVIALDAAVLFEAGFQSVLDKTIIVLAPLEVRIERAVKRGNLTKEQITARANSQMSDKEKAELADFIIQNDGQHSLLEQVDKILQVVSNPY
ncbi:MAG: dephospho-CoA kinase [Petrimonas sp.]|uniref:dephospho-CoA kinase n=1 Tax=Petrimonas sp. TaxID=2023866 RepID=UPI002B3E462E|nr:dephospho-CoA kinase [Petrimonas sp.]MEA5044029.1 dephospho-CoA kinase [Petrimonas sp.]